MKFKQKLHIFIEKLVDESKYFNDWASEHAIYTQDGAGQSFVDNFQDFYPYLAGIFEQDKEELYSWIEELYEHVEFTRDDCKFFKEKFSVHSEYPEEDDMSICENTRFKDWVFKEIINYLR